jgi:hypothetical protein
MLIGPTEYPALLGALLVLNWPVYVVLYRQAFTNTRDLKLSFLAAMKTPFFWKDGEPWSAGKLLSFFLVCGLIVMFEYAILGAVLARVIE